MRRTVESKFDLVSAEYRLGRAARQAGAAQQSVTFRFQNFSVSKLFHFFLWYRYRFRKFLVSKKVSVSVSKKIGIGKKYRYRFRFFLVSEKVSVSVSKFFGIEKSIGIGFEKKLVLKKYESVSKQFG